MSDPFEDRIPGLESPATVLTAVTPSDSLDLETPSRALNVANAGTI